MKQQKFRPESAVKRCCIRTAGGVKNTYRLLRCVDIAQGTDIYSLFLTTETENTVDEEFLFDLSRTETAAISFYDYLIAMNVTACTLIDIASDLFSEYFADPR